eukprot:m.14247 g.14247  ORF g.14247 m.14247 type:complete len:137 (-) comp6171_c0_seq2:150-560(-)
MGQPVTQSSQEFSYVQPMSCGVLLYYHIPKTGGTSLRLYLEQKAKREDASFYFHKGDQFTHTSMDEATETLQAYMADSIANRTKHVWHIHHLLGIPLSHQLHRNSNQHKDPPQELILYATQYQQQSIDWFNSLTFI